MGTYKITTLIGQAPYLPWWRIQCMTDAEIAAYNRSFMKEVEMTTANEARLKEIEDAKISEYHKENIRVWNAAIEAAAVKINELLTNYKLASGDEIRKLKK